MNTSLHELRAALRVARIIDESGNRADDVRISYRNVHSQGEHRAYDLDIGEAFLARIGLLVMVDGRLLPSGVLSVVVGASEDVALSLLEAMARDAAALGTEDSGLTREEIGAAGEDAVVTACREELILIGRMDLCVAVQRVSLVSDSLGYDVSGPRVLGPSRMLEVKTMGSRPRGSADFFISRNEFEVGRQHPSDWALVVCSIVDGDQSGADVIGWCRAQSLGPYLPEDRNGRWLEALVKLPVASLISGIPSSV